jgi:hypothetical protein
MVVAVPGEAIVRQAASSVSAPAVGGKEICELARQNGKFEDGIAG